MRRYAALAFAVACAIGRPPMAAFADDTLHTEEQQIGAQEYAALQKKGEIIPRPNALYDTLDPIAKNIAAIANPQYDFPFQFILVHEAQPNAFAVPGGNVYVTDSLMKFVQNTEELSGVLCHETSHDIHHDVVNNMQKDQTVGTVIGILGAITGLNKSGFGQLSENAIYTLQSDSFSRTVEGNADHKGAITCAQAGYNPWGMVWLFQNFEKADTGGSLEVLSDHPNDQHRINALQAEFRKDPATFGKFSPDIRTATPLSSAPGSKPYTKESLATPGPVKEQTQPYCCSPKH